MFALNRTKTATSQKLPCILFLLLFIYFIYFFTPVQTKTRCYRFTHELPKWVQMIKFLIVCNKVESKVSAPIW